MWIVTAPIIYWAWFYAAPFAITVLKYDPNKTHSWARFGSSVLFMVYFISFAFYIYQLLIRVRRANGRLCPLCKYSLVNLPGPGFCPECGRAFPEDGYQSFWSKWLFLEIQFALLTFRQGDLEVPTRRDRIIQLILHFANIAFSLAIIFFLLPSMNCLNSLLHGCDCISELRDIPQLLTRVLLSVTFAICFHVTIFSIIEWKLFDMYLRRLRARR